jgi:uncharacterized protein DUF1524
MFKHIVALILLFTINHAYADYVVVKKNANIYLEANKNSELLLSVGPSPGSKTILNLERKKMKNGYYHVRLPDSSDKGWIYKTLVRRYKYKASDIELYQRRLYKHWVDIDRDCQDTRVEVLIRDAHDGHVTYKSNNKCRVTGGKWYDPYTNKIYTNPKRLDVDHVVPLKNAHLSGGWAWSKEKKEKYANNMDDKNHLLAVSLSENRRKGAKGPDKYMPPNENYHCEYINIWQEIKFEWGLSFTESEAKKIEEVLAVCN